MQMVTLGCCKRGGGKKGRKGSKKERLEELILTFHVQEVELSECRGLSSTEAELITGHSGSITSHKHTHIFVLKWCCRVESWERERWMM